jgi:hypothetical protein
MEREQAERRNLEFQMDVCLKEKEGHSTPGISSKSCVRAGGGTSREEQFEIPTGDV